MQCLRRKIVGAFLLKCLQPSFLEGFTTVVYFLQGNNEQSVTAKIAKGTLIFQKLILLLNPTMETLSLLSLESLQKHVLTAIRQTRIRSIGEALNLIDNYEIIYLSKFKKKEKHPPFKNNILWRELLKIFNFNECKSFVKENSRLCGLLEIRSTSTCLCDLSWKEYRLEWKTPVLIFVDNEDNVMSFSALQFALSKDYLAIYLDGNIYIYSSLPSYGHLKEINVSHLSLVCFQIVQTFVGVVVVIETQEENTYTLTLEDDFSITTKLFPEISNGAGYLGLYFRDEIIFYKPYEEIEIYPVFSSEKPYRVHSTGYRDIDLLTNDNDFNILYDALSLNKIWQSNLSIRLFDSFAIHGGTISDVVTGRLLFETHNNEIVANITRKGDGSGYFVWVIKLD